MLVRSLKCRVCGSHKINPPQNMFIYCDYCGSWMGFDMLSATREVVNIFTPERMQDPLIQEYLQVLPQAGVHARNKDKPAFIEKMLRFHELEFLVFPRRFGPKGKQLSFRKKYLEYQKAYYNKVVDDKYFNDKYINPPAFFDMMRLKFRTENGVNIYEFDDAFKEMLDYQVKWLKDGISGFNDEEVLSLHPEGDVVKDGALMLQFSLSSMLQSYDKETIEKSVEYLGLKDDFIEVPDVVLNEVPCIVCKSILKVPEGSDRILCETCGTLNEVKTGNIDCHNCGASFMPKEDNACPYCGSVFLEMTSASDAYKKNDP